MVARAVVVRALPIRQVLPRLKDVQQAISQQQAARRADAAQGRRGRGAQGPPVTLEMHLAEYKAVNGIKFPHLITRGVSGETNEEWVIKSYKVNPNLKANTFTK